MLKVAMSNTSWSKSVLKIRGICSSSALSANGLLESSRLPIPSSGIDVFYLIFDFWTAGTYITNISLGAEPYSQPSNAFSSISKRVTASENLLFWPPQLNIPIMMVPFFPMKQGPAFSVDPVLTPSQSFHSSLFVFFQISFRSNPYLSLRKLASYYLVVTIYRNSSFL